MIQYFKKVLHLFRCTLNRCTECGVPLKDLKMQIVDRIDFTPVEMEWSCKNCGSIQEYEAYGLRDRDYNYHMLGQELYWWHRLFLWIKYPPRLGLPRWTKPTPKAEVPLLTKRSGK